MEPKVKWGDKGREGGQEILFLRWRHLWMVPKVNYSLLKQDFFTNVKHSQNYFMILVDGLMVNQVVDIMEELTLEEEVVSTFYLLDPTQKSASL